MSAEYMTVIPGTIPTRKLHGYLLGATSPRPIAFASTISPDGTPNLAPFSFFNVFSAKPPVLIFSPARRVRDNTTKDTLQNIIDIPEVVINVVSYDMVQQMNLASSDYPADVSEFVKAGFSSLPSDLVRPLRVAEAPVQMECKVFEIKPLSSDAGSGNLIFCEVQKMHIHRSILDDNQHIDPHKIDLVGRMGGAWYCRTSGAAAFPVAKPLATPGIGIDLLPDSIRLSKVLTGNDLGQLGNRPALPEATAVQTWWADQGQKPENRTAAHRQAQAMIQAGAVGEALNLLMAADKYLDQ